ncbi:MAG: thrombospondin type 3 repeat-containing protein [Anaeromyxobacter sp.]
MLAPLVVALALTAEPAAPAFQQAFEAVRRACRTERPFRLQGLLGVRSACEAVLDGEPPATRALLQDRIGRLQRLRPAAASAVVGALLAFAALPAQGPPGEAEARQASEAFVKAARASRGELAVVADFVAFTSWRLPDEGTWLAALDSSPDPVRLAKRLLSVGKAPPDPIAAMIRDLRERHPASPWDATARALVVARTRGRLDPVVGGPRSRYCSEAVADLAIFERLIAERAPAAAVGEAAAALLASRPSLAAPTYDALSAEARAAAFARLEADERGFEAAVTLLAGGVSGAALELANRPGPAGSQEGWRLVRALANAEPLDPFGVFLAVRMSPLARSSNRAEELARLLAGRHLLARRPDLARSLLQYEAQRPPRRCGVEDSVRALLPSHAARVEAAEAAYVAAAREVILALPPASTPDPRATSGDDPVSATVARLLAAPLRTPFTEEPLPEAPGAPGKAPVGPVAKDVLPEGWEPVRVERSGKDVVAIALAQDLDPAGELSGGGYWLLRGDGAGTWRSTYLGLRAFRPYEVARTSNVALLAGAVVRIEARRRALDDGSTTFPPLRLRTEAPGAPVLLSARLVELERDSDGDGLSDLVEDRLLTDPADPDTDHDGSHDGDDPSPLVPGGPRSALAGMLEAALTGMRVSMAPIRQPPAEPGQSPGQDPLANAQVAPLPPPATFIESERTLWRGVRTSRRVIVLTHAEADLASARFGAFFLLRVQELLRSDDGRRVYLGWDERWRGGELVLEDGPSGWKIVASSEWVS